MRIKEQIDDFKQFTKGIFPRHIPWKLAEMGYFTLPASIAYHGTEEGDLYLHSKIVAMTLQDLTERNELSWRRSISPMIIGLFHDLCKTDNYMYQNGVVILNPDRKPGHGEKSAELAKELMDEMTEEELICIRYHMGAYEGKEAWQQLGKAIKKYPNIIWTHHADMIVSQVWKV